MGVQVSEVNDEIRSKREEWSKNVIMRNRILRRQMVMKERVYGSKVLRILKCKGVVSKEGRTYSAKERN